MGNLALFTAFLWLLLLRFEVETLRAREAERAAEAGAEGAP